MTNFNEEIRATNARINEKAQLFTAEQEAEKLIFSKPVAPSMSMIDAYLAEKKEAKSWDKFLAWTAFLITLAVVEGVLWLHFYGGGA